MTPTDAQKILATLADGIDPETGEVLPEGSPLNQPQVIRALFMAVQALGPAASKAEHANAARPGNVGKPWTEEEEERLLAAFDSGTPKAELAKIHGRTGGAIHSRLIRLGRLQAQHGGAAD